MIENVIRVTEAQIDEAVEEVGNIIAVGEKGTRGDYTELGALVTVLSILGIKVVPIDDDE